MESLSKVLEGTKAAEWALKVNETIKSLHKEVEAERQSNATLGAQVNLLTKRLEDASAIGLAVAELYIKSLGQFGGVTSPLPSEPSAYNILSLLKSNFVKLPDFVGGAIDFGALSAATNFSKMLI